MKAFLEEQKARIEDYLDRASWWFDNQTPYAQTAILCGAATICAVLLAVVIASNT